MNLTQLAKLEEARRLAKNQQAEINQRLDEIITPARYATHKLEILREYSRRINDALRLYRPLNEKSEAFHACPSRRKLATGSNRAGKTILVAAEIARIVRGLDPHAESKGMPLKNGKLLAVGSHEDHIGDPMWSKLARPGAFYMIQDQRTQAWRSVRPHPDDPTRLDDYDESYRPTWLGGQCEETNWVPAPPLIPHNEIDWKRSSMYKKNAGIPARITIKKTGWEIIFRSGLGHLRKGIIINLGWFDEEVNSDLWLAEILARLVDTRGMFLWSATPEASTPQLYDMHELASKPDSGVDEFHLTIDENPYLTRQAKKEFLASLTPEEARIKYYGEYAITSRRVYPEFNPTLHCVV